MTYEEIPVPEDLVPVVAEWRKIARTIAEYDESFDGEILRRSKLNRTGRNGSSHPVQRFVISNLLYP